MTLIDLHYTGDALETININRPALSSITGGRASTLPSEIDRIMAKIDQDNRVLAELDKTRSTIGKNNSKFHILHKIVNIKYRMFNIYVKFSNFNYIICLFIGQNINY